MWLLSVKSVVGGWGAVYVCSAAVCQAQPLGKVRPGLQLLLQLLQCFGCGTHAAVVTKTMIV
jgi:hypothetical protein